MPAHIDLEAAGAFLGPCRFLGAMYHLPDHFPGVVDGSTLCHGVRYQLNDATMAEALDEFEDVIPGDRTASLYLRKKVALRDDQGQATSERAWIYWYNRTVEGLSLIESGDWPLSAGRPRFRQESNTKGRQP